MDPFEGPRAKVKRAHKHLNELRRAEVQYRKEQPLGVRLEKQPNGETAIVLKAAQLPTAEDSTIAADVIGNLRSALDLAVSEACRIEEAENLAGTYFAFADSEREWEKSVNLCKPKHSRMRAASPALRKLVKSYRPWQEKGNLALYAMSKLVAKDKHQLLVPLAGGTNEMTIDGLRVSRADGKRARFSGQTPIWNRQTGEAVVALIDEGSNVEISGPCVLKASFAFGNVDCVPNQPAIPLLNHMGGIVEHIVEDIARYAKALRS